MLRIGQTGASGFTFYTRPITLKAVNVFLNEHYICGRDQLRFRTEHDSILDADEGRPWIIVDTEGDHTLYELTLSCGHTEKLTKPMFELWVSDNQPPVICYVCNTTMKTKHE